jgi:hypothetical protein
MRLIDRGILDVAPTYLSELRNAIVPTILVRPPKAAPANPVNAFEDEARSLLAEANASLQREEFSLAIRRYQDLQARILNLLGPGLGAAISAPLNFDAPVQSALMDSLFEASVRLLGQAVPEPSSSPPVAAPTSVLPDAVRASLVSVSCEGISFDPNADRLQSLLNGAHNAAAERDWARASELTENALGMVPDGDRELAGRLSHDLGILRGRLGDVGGAVELTRRAADLLRDAGAPDAEHQAL